MGGSIKVSVRFAPDQIESQVRWTNSLPYQVRSRGFCESPAAHLRAYLDQPSQYREDGENVVCPVSYGLVVFDLVTMTLAHSNGYSSFVSQVPLGLAFGDDSHMDDEDRANLQWFIDQKQVQLETETIFRATRRRENVLTPIVDMASAAEQIKANRALETSVGDSLSIYSSLIYDFKPWTVLRFDEGLAGSLKLRDWLLANGFTSSDAEQAAWAEWEADHSGV